jgi:hypothetical protein
MKVTPEIKKYIYDNNTLSSRALASLIESKFNIKIGHVTIDSHLQKARADAQANNSAKVEAVRSAVLDELRATYYATEAQLEAQSACSCISTYLQRQGTDRLRVRISLVA